MWRICLLLAKPALRDTDTPKERARKVYWIPLMALLCIIAHMNLFPLLDDPPTRALSVCLFILTAAVHIGLLWPLCTGQLTLRFMGAICVAMCFGLVPGELSYAARGSTFGVWSWVVLIMDICLAFRVPRTYQVVGLSITVVTLVATRVELAYRLGLFDIDEFTDNTEKAAAACNCSDPPCAVGSDSLVLYLPALLVILLGDFYTTRSFAEALQAEQDRIVTSVRVAERVTELLAAYATDDARRVVQEEGTALPEALQVSYNSLLDNLDSYRAFLPDALLLAAQQKQQQQGEDDECLLDSLPKLRTAPGVGDGSAEVAVCFTDIQSSTELWETRPQGMYEGLNIHNRVMRNAYAACNGYEVKTIGDSFMVAFDSAADALRFGLEAQLGLLRQQWPEDLLTHPLCQRVSSGGEPLWGGLRVRVGVQCGPARVEPNPVTGRCDYFGHTVNTAARLEAVLRVGGVVATTDTVVSALSPEVLQALGSPEIRDAGNRSLKGLKSQTHVYALAPRGLQLRLDAVLTATDPAAEPPDSGGRSLRQSTQFSLRSHNDSSSSCQSRSQQQGSVSHRRARASRIALSMHQSVATCAVVRASLVHCEPVVERVHLFAGSAALAADKTQGVVEAVLSAVVIVTWNASRTCVDHTTACRGFLGAPFRAPYHLGAASGGVLSGSVSAGRRSFATVVGGCVELASALAEEAERCNDEALAAGAIASDCASAGAATWAQLWQAPGAAPLLVWAVTVAREQKWELDPDEPDASASQQRQPARWGNEESAVMRLLCAELPGSDAQCAVLQQRTPGTLAARQCAALEERVAKGGVRLRPMPLLWDPVAPRPQSASVPCTASECAA